jgi:hypothetical protein
VTGTTHTLSKNKSGGTLSQNNTSCQYVVGAGNSNGAFEHLNRQRDLQLHRCRRQHSPTGCVPASPVP